MMKRAKCIEARQNKAIEDKSKLLKNLDIVEKLDFSVEKSNIEEVLEVQNLSINYGETNVFNNLSFTIKNGERVWLRGKNGCGKSSVIKLLIGEDILYNGYIKKTDKISYISQETSFLKGSIDDFIIEQKINEQNLKSTLYKMGFETTQLDKNIENWSEGQKEVTYS